MVTKKLRKRKFPNYWLLVLLIFGGILIAIGIYLGARYFTGQPAQVALVGTDAEPIVGVRHFGGYPSRNHEVRSAHEQLLSGGEWLDPPQDWSDRWPYYTIVRTSNVVDIHEDDQRVIDQEIQLAAAAGIDYWGIEAYGIETSSEGGYVLNLYKSSPYKTQLKYAIITTTTPLFEDNWDKNFLPVLLAEFKDPQYIRLSNNKPLLYMWRFDRMTEKLGKKETENRMRDLVKAIEKEIGVKPYITMMELASRGSISQAKDFSVNAVTSYLGEARACGSGGPYSLVAEANKAEWNAHTNGNTEYIPLVTTGMDTRSKGLDKELFHFGGSGIWCQQPKPKEIAESVQEAINWVKNNRQVTAEGNAILIAAWSDLTETGWLVPTIKEGNARLNALSKVLGGREMDAPRSPYADSPPPPHDKGEITDLNLKDGDTIRANQPLILEGKAPQAARVRVIVRGNGVTRDLRFINGKGIFQKTRSFSIEVPSLPPGGPYSVTIRSFTDDPKFNDFRFVKINNLTAK